MTFIAFYEESRQPEENQCLQSVLDTTDSTDPSVRVAVVLGSKEN